ncbi:hypothetical protein LEAN103870_17475 [Legionella anisa]|uniref:Ankyrin repeat domain-containing protein n=1 Tax=Legionella anisa TaxID=28082 RepID=A0AAX0WWZ9_9GAMM|nr:hypothetical protein [Legionella anisa]KTC72235.1 hypothetical protein Lani_1369 [Legionella anisa]PNL63021.1 hypothetical protein A6J39_018470 [Legionella anisa]UAK78234.1 hypothetical protein K8O89_11035 [Legionella anisa]
MPNFTEKESRLIDLASRGLFQTVNSSQYLKSALAMSQIQPTAIDAAINAAIHSASHSSKEEALKRWQIVVMLCSITRAGHQPSQRTVDKALERATSNAAKTNDWKFVIALASLVAPARQPSQGAIDTALEHAATTAARTNDWNVVMTLANLTPPARQPNQRTIDIILQRAVVAADKTNNWESVIALARLAPPACQPSQEVVDWALDRATTAAVETNEWKSVIALASLAPPARQPSQNIINSLLELLVSKASKYEERGQQNLSSKIWEAAIAIASLQPPATKPDEKLAENAFRQLAKVPQIRTDKHFMNLARKSGWEMVRDYLTQPGIKPSQQAMGYALKIADAGNQWDVIKEFCHFQQPDQRTAGDLLYVAARKGNMEGVRLLCNLDEQNKPNIYFVENASQIAKNAKNTEIVSYLSCEKIRQSNAITDPLTLTQAILQDFIKHTPNGSGLFSSQLRSVKSILSQVNRAAAKEERDDARNSAVLDALMDLKTIMGSNRELKGCFDYIKEHSPKEEDMPLLKAEF